MEIEVLDTRILATTYYKGRNRDVLESLIVMNNTMIHNSSALLSKMLVQCVGFAESLVS